MKRKSELLKIAKDYVIVNLTYPGSYAYTESKNRLDSYPEINREEERCIKAIICQFDINTFYKGLDRLYKIELQRERC